MNTLCAKIFVFDFCNNMQILKIDNFYLTNLSQTQGIKHNKTAISKQITKPDCEQYKKPISFNGNFYRMLGINSIWHFRKFTIKE